MGGFNESIVAGQGLLGEVTEFVVYFSNEMSRSQILDSGLGLGKKQLDPATRPSSRHLKPYTPRRPIEYATVTSDVTSVDAVGLGAGAFQSSGPLTDMVPSPPPFSPSPPPRPWPWPRCPRRGSPTTRAAVLLPGKCGSLHEKRRPLKLRL